MIRRNKYNRSAIADRTTSEGIVFDSRGEMKRWHELQLLARAGKISDLRRQVTFGLVINGRPVKIRSKGYPNGRACNYSADFTYYEGGKFVAEDYKGHDTDASRIRRAVVEAIYNIEIRITGAAAK